MSDVAVIALATVVPFGLVALVAYKMLTRKKRPELTLVKQSEFTDEVRPYVRIDDVNVEITEESYDLLQTKKQQKIADQAVKEVIAKAKKINKNKARRGKRRAKKN